MEKTTAIEKGRQGARQVFVRDRDYQTDRETYRETDLDKHEKRPFVFTELKPMPENLSNKNLVNTVINCIGRPRRRSDMSAPWGE